MVNIELTSMQTRLHLYLYFICWMANEKVTCSVAGNQNGFTTLTIAAVHREGDEKCRARVGIGSCLLRRMSSERRAHDAAVSMKCLCTANTKAHKHPHLVFLRTNNQRNHREQRAKEC